MIPASVQPRSPGAAPDTDWLSALGSRGGDVLPLVDFCSVLSVGLLAQLSYASWATSDAEALVRLSWILCLMAPFILYDRDFIDIAARGDWFGLVRGHVLRLMTFVALAAGIAYAGRWLEALPLGLFWPWLISVLALTSLSRVALARQLRALPLGESVQPQPERTDGSGTRLQSTAPPQRRDDRDGVLLLAERPIRRWSAAIKMSSDYVLGALITLLLSPVLLVVAMAIRLESPGPILFKQRRHGYCNSEFDIYKFRSMRVDCDSGSAPLQQTVRGDLRVTAVGRFIRKWSLDELPQLFNVLRGQMSLVGPRPHAVNMRTAELLGSEIIDSYPHRHRVRPGITGWAQVNGARGATDTTQQLRRRVELDLFYIDHWSLAMDLKVLLRTVSAVLRPTNAF
ncbi:exopolysaccharide biosynthesis polyprenyl glycosylphosphotransferase [Pseudomarimonas salicorniae]|uniref:Exopolysaccharide biosynthesis polyprenyl glycosylphosphotransferase n=1 Tax=Pseudomarimonas salicorniae TaxID=2933270 RepID=A0ABT0GEW5_9GAMM|nr:exopolysaccharide biosynthesis polyprenyl glycosylphosphotransferase [Lysobacter sp. CAU 1642]MCK7593091.1 exopolysaccharide biosynthesis polyprenyl glycosylphosphotransferase [Lysobacter sp. CAU 1642]